MNNPLLAIVDPFRVNLQDFLLIAKVHPELADMCIVRMRPGVPRETPPLMLVGVNEVEDFESVAELLDKYAELKDEAP